MYTDGSSGRIIYLAEISAGRDSGVPQLVADKILATAKKPIDEEED